jgi:membrane-associated phospholipid phosphatase
VLWWAEALAAAVVAAVYVLMPRSAPANDTVLAAGERGADVFALERAIGLDVERGVQSVVGSLQMEAVANVLYGSLHFAVTAAAFVVLLRHRTHSYAWWRTSFVVASLVAFVAQHLWPVAPPRLVQRGDGSTLLADWLAEHPALWTFESGPISELANHHAAMPSMHVGYAVLSAVALGMGRRRPTQVVAGAYPVLVTVVVMATGNHFLLDALAGAAVAGASIAVVLAARRLADRVGGGGRPGTPATTVTATIGLAGERRG